MLDVILRQILLQELGSLWTGPLISAVSQKLIITARAVQLCQSSTYFFSFLFMKFYFSLHASSQTLTFIWGGKKQKFWQCWGQEWKLYEEKRWRNIHYICCAAQKALLSQDIESLLTRIFFTRTMSRLASVWTPDLLLELRLFSFRTFSKEPNKSLQLSLIWQITFGPFQKSRIIR